MFMYAFKSGKLHCINLKKKKKKKKKKKNTSYKYYIHN